MRFSAVRITPLIISQDDLQYRDRILGAARELLLKLARRGAVNERVKSGLEIAQKKGTLGKTKQKKKKEKKQGGREKKQRQNCTAFLSPPPLPLPPLRLCGCPFVQPADV